MNAPLFVYAAPLEGAGLDSAHAPHRFAEVGVGPVRATLGLSRLLLTTPLPDVVCALGVAGAYPARFVPEARAVGELVVVGVDQLADEGVETEAGFESTADLGLVGEARWPAHEELTARLARALAVPIVAGATVATCSGTDARAAQVCARAGASVESMEGAALALVCARFGVPFVQVRAISNLCGDRRLGEWDLAGAVARLHAAVPTVLATLREAN